MYRSLLVPLDGSPFGEQALPLALSVARRAGASLRVVHVHPTAAPLYVEGYPFVDDALDSQVNDLKKAYLDDVVKRLGAVSPVRVTPVLLRGDVAETLREAANGTDADLVVMTTHGRGALGRFWLGSVADQLLRNLTKPLILIRPKEGPPDFGQEPALKRLLLPLDGTALAEQMIEPAAALGSLTDADYTLLRVTQPPAAVDFYDGNVGLGPMSQALLSRLEELQEKLRKEAQDYLDQVAGRLRARGLRVQTKVAVELQPSAAILGEGAPPACDLIALETHGRGGLSRLFLGSVADKVIRGAAVPVLVRRPTF